MVIVNNRANKTLNIRLQDYIHTCVTYSTVLQL